MNLMKDKKKEINAQNQEDQNKDELPISEKRQKEIQRKLFLERQVENISNDI